MLRSAQERALPQYCWHSAETMLTSVEAPLLKVWPNVWWLRTNGSALHADCGCAVAVLTTQHAVRPSSQHFIQGPLNYKHKSCILVLNELAGLQMLLKPVSTINNAFLLVRNTTDSNGPTSKSCMRTVSRTHIPAWSAHSPGAVVTWQKAGPTVTAPVEASSLRPPLCRHWPCEAVLHAREGVLAVHPEGVAFTSPKEAWHPCPTRAAQRYHV